MFELTIYVTCLNCYLFYELSVFSKHGYFINKKLKQAVFYFFHLFWQVGLICVIYRKAGFTEAQGKLRNS